MKVHKLQPTVYSALLAFTFSSTAFGAAKYTKKESEIQANQTALTKPTQHTKDEKHAPTITADDVFQGGANRVAIRRRIHGAHVAAGGGESHQI